MFCKACRFYHGGFMWNRCDLTDSECFRECNDKPCDLVDDNYEIITDCEPLGLIKGESAIEFMEGINEDRA